MSSITDQIKERIDIVEFISAYVPLRKAGHNYIGFCPFHTNTRTPAFTVFPDTQSYHCFGCKATGTVFDFLMQREGLEFRAALEQLAQRAGVQLKQHTDEDEQQDQLRTRLLEINTAAAVFFHHMLVKSPRGDAARAYIAKRGLDQTTTETFQLGYAVPEWSALLVYLSDRKGFEPQEIGAAGLAIQREHGGYFDRFRDRLMFPIRNVKGEVIGFGGRSLGDAQPKYMNSPQTPLFDKGRVLYGLDLARDAIRTQDATVIVEGYVDVIVAHQYGFRNVVAPLGTALTADHVGVLKNLSKQIYLALDADAAGVRATLKGLRVLEQNLERKTKPVPAPGHFDRSTHGPIRWERELEAEIRIIALPEGRDPDEVIRENPEQWPALVRAAQPFMDFYITALIQDLDLQSAKGKSEAIKRLEPELSQIINKVEREYYIEQIARYLKVEKFVVYNALRTKPDQSNVPRPTLLDKPPSKEDYLLGWLLRYPSVCTAVQEKTKRDLELFPLVSEVIQGTTLELFEQIENREIWRAWNVQRDTNDPAQWVQTLDETLQEQVQRVLQLSVPESQSYRYVNDALECARMLQLDLARRWKDRLCQQDIETIDEDKRSALLERLVQMKQYIDSISTPKRSSTYADLHTLRTT